MNIFLSAKSTTDTNVSTPDTYARGRNFRSIQSALRSQNTQARLSTPDVDLIVRGSMVKRDAATSIQLGIHDRWAVHCSDQEDAQMPGYQG